LLIVFDDWDRGITLEQTSNAYTVKIQNFEGPLDLLFHLIEKNKMDIYDIQLAEITEQYLDYLTKMDELNLEVTSEFLVMASTLLLIKSRMLLPEANKAGEEQEDLQDDLVNRLIEYKRYKEFTYDLREREALYSKFFYKAHEIFKLPPAQIINKNFSPEVIPSVYQGIIQRNIRKINPNITSMEEIIAGQKVTVRSKIREVLRFLITKVKFKFSELLNDPKITRVEIVTSFMALLELAKVKRIKIRQSTAFGEIEIKKVPKKELGK
jgi:segregation and condensation protein A